MTLFSLDIVAKLFNIAYIPIHSSNSDEFYKLKNLTFSHMYQSRNIFWKIRDTTTRYRHCLMKRDVMSMIAYP